MDVVKADMLTVVKVKSMLKIQAPGKRDGKWKSTEEAYGRGKGGHAGCYESQKQSQNLDAKREGRKSKTTEEVHGCGKGEHTGLTGKDAERKETMEPDNPLWRPLTGTAERGVRKNRIVVNIKVIVPRLREYIYDFLFRAQTSCIDYWISYCRRKLYALL